VLVFLRLRLDDYDPVSYALLWSHSATILRLQSIDDEASYTTYHPILSYLRLIDGGRSSRSTDETWLGVGREGNFIHALVAAVVVNVILHVENRV
jgi:hypothetical protein